MSKKTPTGFKLTVVAPLYRRSEVGRVDHLEQVCISHGEVGPHDVGTLVHTIQKVETDFTVR